MGELLMRGNAVMKGYLKDPAATAAAFAGGWFHTGDLGVRHPDGYVEVRDRAKDIVITGGENVSTIEVEAVLYRHPAVQEAAVVARPDPHWGETPCAFVTLQRGRDGERGRADRLLPRAAGALQGAAHGGVRPPAQDRHRQDAEVPTAGARPRPAGRLSGGARAGLTRPGLELACSGRGKPPCAGKACLAGGSGGRTEVGSAARAGLYVGAGGWGTWKQPRIAEDLRNQQLTRPPDASAVSAFRILSLLGKQVRGGSVRWS